MSVFEKDKENLMKDIKPRPVRRDIYGLVEVRGAVGKISVMATRFVTTCRGVSHLRRGSRSTLIILMAAGVVMAACGSTSSTQSAKSSVSSTPGSLSSLYAQAKKAHEPVLFANPTQVAIVQPLINAFEKKYPGVTVTDSNITAENLLTELSTQEAAHSVKFDLVEGATDNIPTIAADKIIADVPWKDYNVTLPILNIGSGTGIYYYDLPNVVIYNTNLVPSNEQPTSWQSLLNPTWKGKIALDSRGHFLESFVLDPSLGGASAGLSFAKALLAQNPLMEPRLTAAEQAVESGQAAVGTDALETFLAAKNKGAPIALAPVSPVASSGFFLYVPPGAPNAAGAELLASYLSSSPALKLFASAGYYGLASPCSAGPMADALCKLSIKNLRITTVSEGDQASSFLAQAEKVMKTSVGGG